MNKIRYIHDNHDKLDMEDKKELIVFIIGKVGKDKILEHYTKDIKEVSIDFSDFVNNNTFIDELYNKIKEYIDKLNKPKPII